MNHNENHKMQLYAPLAGAVISLAVAALYHFMWSSSTLSVLWCCIGATQLILFVYRMAKSPEVKEQSEHIAQNFSGKPRPKRNSRHQHKKKRR